MSKSGPGLEPLVDSHAHLNMSDFDQDRNEVLDRAFESGITAILCPIEVTDGKNIETSLRLIEDRRPVYAAAGIHPHLAKKYTAESEAEIRNLTQRPRICAVGEIGLDFHYNFSPADNQIEIFRRQLQIAEELGLPAVIHSRQAGDQIIDSLKKTGFSRGGVLHCFTEDWKLARRMLDLGFFISFSGILTFPKAFDLRETARKIPLERLLVETDSPYLTPVPFRGKIKRNEPRYVRETAQTLAALKGVSLTELAAATTNNFQSCFAIEISV